MNRLMKKAMLLNSLYPTFRVNMAVTLYQLKEQAATIEAELLTVKDSVAMRAGEPNVSMEDLRKDKKRGEELQERLDILTGQIVEMEEAQKVKLRQQGNGGQATMSREEARGRYYQAVLLGQDVRKLPKMVYEQLGAIPTGSEDQGTGSNFLPTHLSNDLLMEPLVDNPLRPFMTITDVTGLELPKLGFSTDDDAFLEKDGATAKEMKLKGDKVVFGNNKMMLKATVSETVLRSTPINVEGAVTAGLQSGQAAKELKVIFAQSPTGAEAAMSLYSTQNAIREVQGATMLDAIMNAYADLEDMYIPNARVVMTRMDYIAMIRDLANGSEALFGKKPEDIIGIPVIFCAKATQPVVGDFSFLHLNFNAAPLYDTDKDVSVGNRLFVLTHWYDIRVKMSAAFRRAKITVQGG